jgi:hypothetical protein
MWPDTLTDAEFSALLEGLNLAPIAQVVVDLASSEAVQESAA